VSLADPSIQVKSTQIASLNLLRGFAALYVCCYHILPAAFESIPFLHSTFSFGYLGLDLFFIISGFIIPYSMFKNDYSLKRFPKFMLKRSVRIEPPYIVSFLIIIFARYLYVQIHNWQYPEYYWPFRHDWKQFGLHFFYLNQYFGYESYAPVYWTLAIEFQFYLLIGFLFPLIIGTKKIIPVTLLVLSSAFIWFFDFRYNWFIFQYGYLFITGILIFLFTVKRISFKVFSLLFVVIATLLYFKNGLDVLVTAVAGTVAIISIKREWKVTNFLGTISYSLYLIHCEAAGWITNYLDTVIKNRMVLCVSAVLFAIGFATLLWYFVERPALKLSKKIRYNKKQFLAETVPVLDLEANKE